MPAAAAIAKSLQLCLTLCDPVDGSPPGSPVPGILQARPLEWVVISFSNAWNSPSQASAVLWTVSFQMFKLVLEKAEQPEIKLPTSIGSLKKKRVPEKHLLLLNWLHQSLGLRGSQWTVENSERDGNTRPPDLPPEKSVCRPRSNS